MAKQDSIAPNRVLRGEGQDEANPILRNNSFFKTNGLRSQFGSIERMQGKLFIVKYPNPVVAVHSNLNDHFWVQTSTTIYMLDNLADVP